MQDDSFKFKYNKTAIFILTVNSSLAIQKKTADFNLDSRKIFEGNIVKKECK